MNARIYLMRHGALPPNPQRRFVGQQDISLSEHGCDQAAAWESRLRKISFAACVCSDLSRCMETAKKVVGARAIPIIQEPAFRELSLGAWEGLTPQEVEEHFPGAYAKRGANMAYFRPEGGESFADLAQRVLPVFDQWRQRHLGHPLLVVAHAGVNRVILARTMSISLSAVLDIPQPYGCCTCLPAVEIGSDC